MQYRNFKANTQMQDDDDDENCEDGTCNDLPGRRSKGGLANYFRGGGDRFGKRDRGGRTGGFSCSFFVVPIVVMLCIYLLCRYRSCISAGERCDIWYM